MSTLITIAIIWGILASLLLIAIGWRLVHALEEIAQAQVFLANSLARKEEPPASAGS